MASFKYIIKGNSNPSVIYARFTHGKKIDCTKSTSLLINTKYWNKEKGCVKQISEFTDKLNFQNKLNDLEKFIINNFFLFFI